MRLPNRSRTLVVLLLGLACERPASPSSKSHQVAAATPTRRTDDSATLAALAARLGTPGVLIPTMSALTPTVDSGITLMQWLASHPGDVVTDTATVGVWDSAVCRVASASVAGTDGRFVRTAIFELPVGPVGDSLPAIADAGDWCRLGAVQVSAHFADTLASRALFDSLARALTGESTLQHFESDRAEVNSSPGTMTWYAHAGRVMVGEMADRPLVGMVGYYDHPPAGHGRRVLGLAYAPGSALDPSDRSRWDLDDRAAEAALMRSLADSALGMVGIPALDARLRPLVSPTKHDSEALVRSAAHDSALVEAAEAVRAASTTLSPARRAAALVALDFAVQLLVRDLRYPASKPPETWDGIPDSLLRERLAPAGIVYESNFNEASLIYTRSLLTAAHAADSLGRGGHLAFLMLTQLGWNTSDACGETDEQFETVILHGENAVRHGDDDPLTHYFVGLAWADIVTLAGQRGEQFARSRAPFVPRSSAARAKAIEHLRSAVAGLHDPTLRAHAWSVGMSLLLGQSSGTRFYCRFVD